VAVENELQFVDSNTECVNISLVDDLDMENATQFLLVLHTMDQAVNLEPQYAIVTILDDDFPEESTGSYS